MSKVQRSLKPKQSVLSGTASILTLGWSNSSSGRLLLRRAIANLVRAGLRVRSSRFSPDMLTSALVFSPHPDDESFGCGGTLALLSRGKVAIHVAFITDGGASHPFHAVVPPKEISQRRRKEAIAAAGALGIGLSGVTFLEAPDGALARLHGEDLQKTLENISAVLTRVMPDAILLPCRRDGSSEHDAAFWLARRALDGSGLRPRIFEFPVWSWWNPMLLLRSMFEYKKVWRVTLGDAREAKARAIASYVSQTHPIPPDTTSALPPGFASMFLGDEEFLLEK